MLPSAKNICIKISCLSKLFVNSMAVQVPAERFDVFSYEVPPYFIKSVISKGIQFRLENNDTSFCNITLYKKHKAGKSLKATRLRQWNLLVRTSLSNVDQKPLKTMSGENLDGWETTLSVGNFYHNKKKCVVLLYSFKRGSDAACIVFAFSDKLFKQPVEAFSNNLHLVNGE